MNNAWQILDDPDTGLHYGVAYKVHIDHQITFVIDALHWVDINHQHEYGLRDKHLEVSWASIYDFEYFIRNLKALQNSCAGDHVTELLRSYKEKIYRTFLRQLKSNKNVYPDALYVNKAVFADRRPAKIIYTLPKLMNFFGPKCVSLDALWKQGHDVLTVEHYTQVNTFCIVGPKGPVWWYYTDHFQLPLRAAFEERLYGLKPLFDELNTLSILVQQKELFSNEYN